MDVSLIICTWNNSSRLKDTLEAVCACEVDDGLDWELIVVDNNSTDDTRSVVSSFESRLPIVYLFEPRQGKSHALNDAIRTMRGELAIFADDDVRPCREWMDIYWKAYVERPTGRYFGGPVQSIFEGRTLDKCLVQYAPWSVKGLDWGVEDGEPDDPDGFIGSNWAAPSEAIRQAGEFDTSIGLNPDRELRVGEETAMMRSLRREGWHPWYLARASIEHMVPAEKVTVEHIAARTAASSKLLASTESDVNLQKVFRAFAKSMLFRTRYLVSRILMNEWRPKYVLYRKHKARAVGYLRQQFRHR